MSVSSGSYLEGFHKTAKAQGAPLVSSDFTFVIDGHEDTYLLAKQFPFPLLSTGEPIERAMPLGSKMSLPGQIQPYRQGPVTFYETVLGQLNKMLVEMICKGGHFNAWIYNGTLENNVWRRRIVDAHMTMDSPDLDMESSTTLLMFSGTLHYHYFGKEEAGNVPHLNGAEGQGGKC